MCKICARYNDDCLENNVVGDWQTFLSKRSTCSPSDQVVVLPPETLDTNTDPRLNDPTEPSLTKDIIFNKLSQLKEIDTFSTHYIDNLKLIHEHTKQDILNFLTENSTECDTENQLRDKLGVLRVVLFEKLCELFPEMSSKEMLGRRKSKLVADDIYIIGFSIVNALQDKRVDKILKQASHISNTTTGNDLSQSFSENTDLIEVCVTLKSSVKDLVKTIASLKKDMTELRQTIGQLQQDSRNQITCACNNTPVSTSAPTSETEDGQQTDTDQEEGQFVNATVTQETTDTSSDNVTEHPTSTVPHPSVSQSTEIPSSNDSGNFQLQPAQRKQVRRGNKKPGVKRDSITGGSPNTYRITAASQQDKLRTVYIGKLSPGTTVDDLRAHLYDVGIEHVSDVQKLNCRNPDEASFCVSVDSAASEDIIFTSGNWPAGARVRPFKARTPHEQREHPSRVHVRPAHNSRSRPTKSYNADNTRRETQPSRHRSRHQQPESRRHQQPHHSHNDHHNTRQHEARHTDDYSRSDRRPHHSSRHSADHQHSQRSWYYNSY